MTKLLEMKDKCFKFYGEYATYLFPVIKFVLALTAFLMINRNVGYMEKISTFSIALILALLCCLLPVNAIIGISAILILLNLYTLSLEVALTAFMIFAVVCLLYFRFSPRDGIVAVLTPVLFRLHIPYIMPVGCGLLRGADSLISMLCGTVIFYFLDGIKKNASALLEMNADENMEMASRFNVTIGQLFGNKEMYLVLGVFGVSGIVVSLVRRIRVDYAWTFAIICGILVEFLGLFIGYIMLGISGKAVGLVVGNLVSVLAAFVLKFLFMNLDYARTERVQFEDDEYYYYVKAVPKKMVAVEEKTVKHFGNTANMGKKIDRNRAGAAVQNEELSRRVIAHELDIDEDLLK